MMSPSVVVEYRRFCLLTQFSVTEKLSSVFILISIIVVRFPKHCYKVLLWSPQRSEMFTDTDVHEIRELVKLYSASTRVCLGEWSITIMTISLFRLSILMTVLDSAETMHQVELSHCMFEPVACDRLRKHHAEVTTDLICHF